MINAVVEGILEFILELFFRFIIEVVCFYTGEIILSIVTFGRKKPRWDYYSDEAITKWILLTDLSTCIGIAFWLFAIGFIIRSISNS